RVPSIEGDELAGQAPAQREIAEQRARRQLDQDLLPGLQSEVAPAADGGEVVDEAQGCSQHQRDQHEASGQRAVGDQVEDERHQHEHQAARGRRPRLAVMGRRAFFADLLAHPRARQLADRRRENQGADNQGGDENDQWPHGASRICSTTRSRRIPREPLTSTCVCAVSRGVSDATACSALSTSKARSVGRPARRAAWTMRGAYSPTAIRTSAVLPAREPISSWARSAWSPSSSMSPSTATLSAPLGARLSTSSAASMDPALAL